MARCRRTKTAATVKALKIISGGQTGVDRAALDVALKHGIDCGGWCPTGRLDEFGRIPDRYPVQELGRVNKEARSLHRAGGLETIAPSKNAGIFAERTLANVKDSDATIIIYCARLRGGTEYTLECCKQLRRPRLLIDASKVAIDDAAKLITDFLRKKKIGILNVAGPRQSEWSQGYDWAFRALDHHLSSITSKNMSRSRRQSYS